MSLLDGGQFGSGFFSAVVSSLISSGISLYSDIRSMFDFIGNSGMSQNTLMALQIASGGLSGGVSSSIAGGNFWQGLRQGLITSGLNHAAEHLFGYKKLSKSKFSEYYLGKDSNLSGLEENLLGNYFEDLYIAWAKENGFPNISSNKINCSGCVPDAITDLVAITKDVKTYIPNGVFHEVKNKNGHIYLSTAQINTEIKALAINNKRYGFVLMVEHL